MTDSQAASAISDISQALQTMRETGLEQRLVPNDALASQVEAALSALSTGASTSDADFFLRSVLAHPPAALSAAAALLRDPSLPTPAAAHYAASALAAHSHAAPAPVAALARHTLSQRPFAPAVTASLARAAAYVAVRCERPSQFSEEMSVLREAAAVHGAECVAFEAVVAAATELAECDPRLHDMCAIESRAVLVHAASVLLSQDPAVSPQRKLDAVAAIRGWTSYAGLEIRTLVHLLTSALQQAAALRMPESLVADIASAIGVAVESIMSVSDDLQFQATVIADIAGGLLVSATSDPAGGFVLHAAAEVCVSIADACADSFLEDSNESSLRPRNALVEAISATVRLMQHCIQCPLEQQSTFEASTCAWSTWIAASLPASSAPLSSQAVCVIARALPDVVRYIVFRLRGMQAALAGNIDCDDFEAETAHARLRNAALDTLHQAAQSLSVTNYIEVVMSWPEQDETTLFALSAASDVTLSSFDVQAVSSILPFILSIIQPGLETSALTFSPDIRRAGFSALVAFAHVLVSPTVGDELLTAILKSACSALADLGHEPAMLLQELADAGPARLVPFLHLIIEATLFALSGSSLLMLRLQQCSQQQLSAPELAVCALARVASELPEAGQQRQDAFGRIVSFAVDNLNSILATPMAPNIAGERGYDVSAQIARDLRLCAMAARRVNDSNLASSLLESLARTLSILSRQYAADSIVAPAMCMLLEACASPTLVDPGDSEPTETTSIREHHLRLFPLYLASDGFAASGPHGECSWLMTIAELSAQAQQTSVPSSGPALTLTLQRVLQGLEQYLCISTNDDECALASRPEMLRAFLKLISALLKQNNIQGVGAICDASNACAQVASRALSVDDPVILEETLSWWSLLLTSTAAADAPEMQAASRIVHHAGGVIAVRCALVRGACAPCATRKCAHAAADALLATRQWGDLHLLNLDGVALSSAEQTLAANLLATRAVSGTTRQFRTTLANIGRLCRREIQSLPPSL
jgi:hypothetical protein